MAAFYEGRPDDPGAYRRKLEEVRRRFADPAARARAAAALTPTSDRARERLERFVREGGAMVTTGQQAGLFLGPLYTVHKILSAIRLAEALEARLGAPVLPVFWIASEDHDFAEVNHAHAVDGAGELRRFAVGAREPLPFSMSATHLRAEMEPALAGYLEAIGARGEEARRLGRVLAGYRPGASVADAFQEAVLALFSDEPYGGFDLFVTRADDPHLKEASVPVLLREAEDAAAHERVLAERTRALEAVGYPAQVAVLEGATNLFHESPEAGRQRLHRAGDGFVVPESGRRFTRAELLEEIRAHPGRFSPNVFLRPVVESAVFPTLAYVGGPAECAYFAQLNPLFHAFGMLPPVVFPRFSATLVPAEVEAKLAGLGLAREELAAPEHELLERLAVERLPAGVREGTAELRRLLVAGFGGVLDAAEEIDPNLGPAVGGRRDRALLEVARAERTILRHFKQRHPELERDLRAVRSHLRPLGAPQERVLTVFQYLVRAPRLLHDLAAAMQVELPEEEPRPASPAVEEPGNSLRRAPAS